MKRPEPPELETRLTHLPVELRAAGGSRRIGGYAAVFGVPSRDLGGFTEKLGYRVFNKSQGDNWPDVMARFNHEDTMLLGTTRSGTLSLRVDNRGLDYTVTLPEHRGDVLELVGRGDVANSSFAFQAYDDSWGYQDGTALRTLLSVRLIDVAPVVTPAYTSTSAGLRSLARFVDAPIEDVVERAARDELRAFFVRTGSPRVENRTKPSGGKDGREALLETLAKRWPHEPKSGRQALLETLARRWPDYEPTGKSGRLALIETLGEAVAGMTAINRPLTDEERDFLLLDLAANTLADEFNRTQTDRPPCSKDQATAVLHRLSAEGKLEIVGDAEDVRVYTDGTLLVEAKRDWLAFHAAHPGNDPMKDRR